MGQQINLPGGPQGPGKPHTALQLARSIGVPPARAVTDNPKLIAQEQQKLTACEAALENLRIAFFAAGKALQVIRDAKLYRESHTTFEEYTLERWDITPQYAGKLIRCWRVAEIAFEQAAGGSNDLETKVSKKLGFTHAWELVVLAEKHSVEAAAALYLALLNKSRKVTAELVAAAVEAMPDGVVGHPRKLEAFVERFVQDWAPQAKAAALDPAKAVLALRKATTTFGPDVVRAALEHDPRATRQAARDLILSLSESAGLAVIVEDLDESADAVPGPRLVQETPAA
ncbi:hypothetical protein [Streptomyces sp. AP-93]|uniref:hypothetical protein n=1 Tax=Streptomyces sp. AP-93 TaxID=2929048 RepID=UPI001FAFE6AE|nr:hypothetical protein [Streptomyces sp. AP-93]MCJ0875242.1 hypothetical protein [Streptomyces sp. AP-93]